ncbi:hypothetical protein LCGC14_3102770, partial [marine sediment metagenome]
LDPYGYGNPHFKVPFGQRPKGWSRGWDFRDCKITRAQVKAIESIRNTHGEIFFRWLGWVIGDTMHIEPQIPPSRAQIDWTTVPNGEIDMPLLPLMYGHGYAVPPPDAKVKGDQSAKVEDVRALQDLMNLAYGARLKLDGQYGPATVAAAFQFLAGYSGHSDAKTGRWVGGNQWGDLHKDLVKAIAGSGGQGEQGEQGIQGEEGEQGEPGEPGAPGAPGEPGEPGEDGKPVTLTIIGDTQVP